MTDDFSKPLPRWIYYRWDVMDALEAIGAESAWSEAGAREMYVRGLQPPAAAELMRRKYTD